MKLKLLGLPCVAISLLTATGALSKSPDGHAFEVRNETGNGLVCSVRRDGSSRTERVILKTGQVWTRSYSDGRDRRMRCDGPYSAWHKISAGTRYSLIEKDRGMLVLRASSATH